MLVLITRSNSRLRYAVSRVTIVLLNRRWPQSNRSDSRLLSTIDSASGQPARLIPAILLKCRLRVVFRRKVLVTGQPLNIRTPLNSVLLFRLV